MYFPGCPNTSCKKKCSPEGNDIFRCEPCGKSYNEKDIRWTYTITCKVEDLSDSLYVSFISEQGEFIMGMPPMEFEKWKNSINSVEDMREGMMQKYFKSVSVLVRVNVDNYSNMSDEVRYKYNASRVGPVDLKEENQMLLRRLQLYSSK